MKRRRSSPYREPSPPPSEPAQPKDPASKRARAWLKQRSDSPTLKAIGVLLTLVAFTLVGEFGLASELPLAHQQLTTCSPAVRLGVNAFFGLMIIALVGAVVALCYFFVSETLEWVAKKL